MRSIGHPLSIQTEKAALWRLFPLDFLSVMDSEALDFLPIKEDETMPPDDTFLFYLLFFQICSFTLV